MNYELERCPVCNKTYGFIHCKVTEADGRVRGLGCGTYPQNIPTSNEYRAQNDVLE